MQSQNQIILHLYFIINQKRKYKLKFEFNRWLTGFTIVRYRIIQLNLLSHFRHRAIHPFATNLITRYLRLISG